jgi:inorganic triphosphatase YgiF
MREMEEQEEKFEVDPDWVMPQLERLVPDGGRLDQRVRNLDDTCFDTAGAGLRLFGVTLQRRVGGSETGWQLKIPYGTARTELQIGAPTKGLPRALGKALAGLRAGERLDPVATVNTTRTAYRVLNLDGELVLELADDHVESHLPDGQSTLHSWREVGVELGPAETKKDLNYAQRLLRAAGATPGTVRTKLDRAAVGPMSSNGVEPAAKAGTVGELVGAYLAAQCVALASNDIGLRTGAFVVHQTRVAARRLRSTLQCLQTCSMPLRLRS